MHCGAEWTEGKSISVQEKCPFCGKTLMVTFSDSEELSMARVLRQMVEIYGVDIISNQNKCISIFKDIAPELRNEQKILSVALTSGVGEYFTTCPVDERESNIKKAVHSMNYLSNDAKSLVVSSLAGALGWDTEIAERSLQQAIKDSQNNDQSLVKENCNIGMTSATPNQTNVSTNNINAVSAGGTKATNTNNTATVVGKGISFNRKWAVVAASVLVVLFGGYSMFSSGKDTSVTPVQNKQVISEVNANNVKGNRPTTSQDKSNNSIQGNAVKSPVRDVIKESRNRGGWISPAERDKNNSNVAKYNAKTALGNPINFCADPNYILVYEGSGKVQYLIRDTLEFTKNSSGTIVEIEFDTADIENPNNAKPHLIGIGGRKVYFNEETGLAGTNFGKVTPFEYYTREKDMEYLPQSAAMAYFLVTGKKWTKFRYGNDFYSRSKL